MTDNSEWVCSRLGRSLGYFMDQQFSRYKQKLRILFRNKTSRAGEGAQLLQAFAVGAQDWSLAASTGVQWVAYSYCSFRESFASGLYGHVCSHTDTHPHTGLKTK